MSISRTTRVPLDAPQAATGLEEAAAEPIVS